MADHGQVINQRTYFVSVGPDGKQVVTDTPPANGSEGFLGIGAKPNTPAVQYHEATYEDGTKMLSHFDAASGDWKQDSVEVDRGVQSQYNRDHPAAKAPADENKPPDIHTNPDGSQDIWNPTTRQYEPYKPAKQAAAKGPDLQTFPDGSQGHWDPAAKGGQGDWVIDFTKPQGPTQAESKPGTVPGLGNAPAERPGQLTNLDLVYAQANQFIAGVNAETNLSPQQRQAKIQAYLDGTVKPAAEQATREANAYAQQQQQRQQETAARAGRTEDRQTSTAERQTADQEATQRLNEQKFSYDRGQDAVSNALKLLQYQVDPSFSPALAGVYNRIMPGAFQPNAFQTALPDIDAIAQAHIGPLLDMHASPVTGPTAQGAAALTAAQPGQVPGQPQPDPLANVPITPRAPYPQPGGTGIVGRFGQ